MVKKYKIEYKISFATIFWIVVYIVAGITMVDCTIEMFAKKEFLVGAFLTLGCLTTYVVAKSDVKIMLKRDQLEVGKEQEKGRYT